MLKLLLLIQRYTVKETCNIFYEKHMFHLRREKKTSINHRRKKFPQSERPRDKYRVP